MINIGILGSGYIAETHANSINLIPEAKLCAVAGGSRAKQFSEKFSIKQYQTIDELISSPNIDAVIICTPHGIHKDEAIEAIKNSKSVFVEKPMALNICECEQIIETSIKNETTLMVGHSQRYFPTNIKVRELLKTEYFGKPLVIRSAQFGAGPDLKTLPKEHWLFDQKLGGIGTTLGYGIHNIDKLLWWLGSEPDLIYGTFRYDPDSNKEHGSFINFKTKSGVDVSTTFQGNFNGKVFDYQRDCAEIICERGHIECQTYRGVKICSESGEWSTILELNFRKERSLIYGAMMQDFINAINKKNPISITGEEGLRAVKLIELAYESYKTKRIISW